MHPRASTMLAMALACTLGPGLAVASPEVSPASGEGRKNRAHRGTWTRPPERLQSKGHSDSLLRMLGKKKRRG